MVVIHLFMVMAVAWMVVVMMVTAVFLSINTQVARDAVASVSIVRLDQGHVDVLSDC